MISASRKTCSAATFVHPLPLYPLAIFEERQARADKACREAVLCKRDVGELTGRKGTSAR